jgi:uncharacterized protein (DUF427 family)
MPLTAGTGPFSKQPAGRFNFAPDPATGSVLFLDPVPQRIRVVIGGETVVDSTRAKLLHETGHLPVYYLPEEDVRSDLLEPSQTHTHCPHKGEASYWSVRAGGRTVEDAAWYYPEPHDGADFLRGHIAFYWDRVDEWWAEDEQLFEHARDPYSRIDIYPTSRTIRILVEGEPVAETTRARILFESNLPPRYYIPREDVRGELLEPSDKHSRCAYKGEASYFHVRVNDTLHEDLIWFYPDPAYDGARVKDLLCFWNERVDIEIDGELQERPSRGVMSVSMA